MRFIRLHIQIKEDWGIESQLVSQENEDVSVMKGVGVQIDTDTRCALQALMPRIVKCIQEQYAVEVEGIWLQFKFKKED